MTHKQQNVIPRHRKHLQKPRISFNYNFQAGKISNSTATILFSLVIITVLSGLGFFYLNQVVTTASQGTDVHALEAKIIEIREKNRQLELEGAELRSLKSVEERVQQLNLASAESIAYLQAPENSDGRQLSLKKR